MFNVILELISENCPKRNPEISEQKTESHERNFIFLFIVVSFFLLNSQSAFLMFLDVESSALLGNAKDSEVCMYGFSIQFSCTILQFYCVSFNLLLKEYEEKVEKKSLIIIFVFGFLYPLCHMEDSCSGCLSRRVSSVLLHTLLLSLFFSE